MSAYQSVLFDIPTGERFQRPHVAIRLLFIIISSWLGSIGGIIFGLPYFIFPIASAISISQKGSQRYIQEPSRIIHWIRWLLAFYAYLAQTTDKVVFGQEPADLVRYEANPQGSPTIGSALLRLVFSIPNALVLALLSLVAGLLWIIAAIFILIRQTYPKAIFDFYRGYLRWHARLLTYHASLTDRYPPFSLDTQPEST